MTNFVIVVVTVAIVSYWFEWYFLMVYGSAAVLGILYASYVPYLYALPSRYDKVFTPNNTYNTVIYYAIGEAIVSAIIGYLMEWIHHIMLFVSLLILAVINKFVLTITISKLRKSQY